MSVEIPRDARVIGGKSEGAASFYLIVSKNMLPYPPAEDQEIGSKRPKGVFFPTSALSNLMAAYAVDPTDVPVFKHERGRSLEGKFGDFQFNYREAMTETGWLTAVEIYPLEDASSHGKVD
ncbi:MAG: hypothetical protein AAGF25_11835 [Pseudomonadota bacterium]